MKMGPSVADPSTVLCKPAYGGNVYLYYSLDGGGAWETLTILETFSYRTEAFTEVQTSHHQIACRVLHVCSADCCNSQEEPIRVFEFILVSFSAFAFLTLHGVHTYERQMCGCFSC